MKAPLLRACVTRLRTFATERAQRGRRSLVQVCLVKSITSSAVSLGTIVAGLSAGGGRKFGVGPSSMTICAGGAVRRGGRRPAEGGMATTSLHTPFLVHSTA